MPMLPYPPSTKPGAAENSLLRVPGGILAFLSILLALIGVILHQGIPDLILAIIVGMLALRVFLLWLGDKPQRQQSIPGWSFMDPGRHPVPSRPYAPGQPAPHASPYFQSQPPYQLAPEQHWQQTVPVPPAAAALSPSTLPNSIRPQRRPKAPAFPARPAPPSQVVQPIPPSSPSSLWLPSPYASVPMPSPDAVPSPSQEGNWQYDDGKTFT